MLYVTAPDAHPSASGALVVQFCAACHRQVRLITLGQFRLPVLGFGVLCWLRRASTPHGGTIYTAWREHIRCLRSAFAKAPADRAWSEQEEAQVASPAVTSDACQAESMAADVSAASVVSLGCVAGSRHPTDFAPPGRRSSSRWAERPVPVLRVVFPEPWSIIAAANVAAAPGAEIAGNLKWSGRGDLNS